MDGYDAIRPTDPRAAELKDKAVEAKMKFRAGLLTYEEVKVLAQPYIDYVNQKAAELAKKYGRRAGKISVTGFLR
jgi:hypothetical protein